MFMHLKKKHLVWMGSIALLSIIIALASWLWLSSHYDKKGQFTGEKKRLSEIFTTLDTAYWRNKEKNLSLSYQAINLSIKINDSNALAQALYYKARVLQNFEQTDSILTINIQALKIAEKYHNDILIAKIKNSIGNYYYYKDNYYLAMLYYTEAIKIAESLKDDITAGIFANGLGLVNLALGDYDKAITCFQRTVNADKKSGYTRGISGAFMNIANCYMEKNDFSKATFYNNKALTIANQIHDNETVCKIFVSLGLINLLDKEGPENKSVSLSYFYKALGYARQNNDRRMYGIALQDIGTFYANNDQLVKAEGFLNQSLSVFSEIGFKSAEKKVNLTLSDIKMKQGQWEKAYQYHLRFVELNDSVQTSETRRKISDYQYEIEFQKKQYEKQLLLKKYDAQKRNNVILIISTLSAIIIALVVRKSLKKSIQLQKMENIHLQEKIQMTDKIKELERIKYQVELEAKNKELVGFSLQLTTKNDLLNEISKISDKYYNSNTLDRNYYHDLTKIIDENLNVDKEWGQFKVLFEKVHQGFFNNLKQDHPDLTEHELRFCAYIKINLRPKEICRILNISTNTVKSFRYRLKKKLALDPSENIEDFLRKF